MSYINNDTFFFFLKKAQDLDLEKALYIFLTRVKFTNSPVFYMRIKKKKNVLDKSFSLQHRNFNENIF